MSAIATLFRDGRHAIDSVPSPPNTDTFLQDRMYHRITNSGLRKPCGMPPFFSAVTLEVEDRRPTFLIRRTSIFEGST
jgi:hypothetical protein